MCHCAAFAKKYGKTVGKSCKFVANFGGWDEKMKG
jgi:hypothetical protein